MKAVLVDVFQALLAEVFQPLISEPFNEKREASGKTQKRSSTRYLTVTPFNFAKFAVDWPEKSIK